MNALCQALTRKAQDELSRDHETMLLNAAFEIEADPGRPDDESAMKRNIRMDDAFSCDLPWLNDELESIRRICSRCEEDFDKPADTVLSTALLQKRYEIEEIREGNVARPFVMLLTPMVGVWAIAWKVRLDDEGRVIAGYAEYLNDGAMDAVTLVKVRARIRQVNEVMERVIGRLSGDPGSHGRSPA